MSYQAENHALKWFIANRDADYVRKACKGLGTNDELLVSTLCNKTKVQLDRISAAYKNKYNMSLKKQLKKETSGYYAKLIVYSQMKKNKFDALMLHDSMAGLGTNDALLIEVLTTRSAEELNDAKTYFEGKYDRSLVDWVKSETSGDYQKAVVRLVTHPRDDNGEVDEGLAAEQAQMLYKAGKAKMIGYKASVFIDILCTASRNQVQAIKAAYEKARGHSLESAVKSKMMGNMENVMVALLETPVDFFARALKKAFKGLGTNDTAVCRILGGSPKEYVLELGKRYQEKYDKSLVDSLKSELSGNFKTAAVTWVSAPDPTGGLEPITEGEDPSDEDLEKENKNLKAYITRCDVADIRRACKGLGTDDKALVNVVCGRTKTQLQAIDAVYREKHGMSLKKQIKSETSGNYGKMVRYSLMKKKKFDAEMLLKAMKGLGTNDSLLIEVMTTRSNAELAEAKEYFEAKNDRSLVDYVASETSGNYKKTLLKLLHGDRDEGEANEGLAAEQAQQLYEAGKGKIGTDEAVFIDILTSASRDQVQAIKAAYERAHGSSLEKAVKSETSGDFEDVLVALLERPVDFYARALKKAFKGFGTDEFAVARILGGNDKEMVEQIAARYEEKYEKSLVDGISSEMSGNFKRAAIMWVAGGAPAELVKGGGQTEQSTQEEEAVEEVSEAERRAAAAPIPPVTEPVVLPVAPPVVNQPQYVYTPPPPPHQQHQQQQQMVYAPPHFVQPPPPAPDDGAAGVPVWWAGVHAPPPWCFECGAGKHGGV